MSVFDKPQRDALVMLFLRLHDHQNTATGDSLGSMAFPLGIVISRSTLLCPRFLGIWESEQSVKLPDDGGIN